MPTGYGVPERKLVEKGLAERILRSARWARSAITSGLPPVPTAGGRALATRIAGMLLGGAVLIVVTVALPPAAGGSDLLILAYGVIAGAVGAVLVARRRVSEPVLGAVAALGTAVITLATLEAGAGTGAEDNEVLYLWVSLFCFWFFGLRHALLQLALIGIADAVLLIDQSPMFAAGVTRWVVTVSTLAVTGLLGAGCGVRWSVSGRRRPASPSSPSACGSPARSTTPPATGSLPSPSRPPPGSAPWTATPKPPARPWRRSSAPRG